MADQTPDSSLVIFRLAPLSQLPFRVTSAALGARSRNVTVRSGWISGDLIGAGRAAAACAGTEAGGACCPASGVVAASTMNPSAADTRTQTFPFMGISSHRVVRGGPY